MKKLLLLLIPFLFISSSLEAQNSPVSYYRKISNEKKKITKKRMKYLQVSLKGDSPRKVEKYRTMVVDQLDASIKAIKKMKPFRGDSVFRNDYIRILNLYHAAYTDAYGDIKALEDSSITSYDAMLKYLDAVENMEADIELAALRLNKNETYFANKFNFTLVVDEELEEQYDVLSGVILYTRDIYRSYYRVEDQIKQFLAIAASGEQLDIRTERRRQQDIARAIEITKSEILKLGDFEDDDHHFNDIIDVLNELDDLCKNDLTKILDLLDEGSYDERQWDKGVKKFEKFVEDLDKYVGRYYESKSAFVEAYLPDDFE